jgi:hypothetical protein
MSFTKDAFARMHTMDPEAVFKALCRVHEDAQAKEGPEAALMRFLRVTEMEPANDEDGFTAPESPPPNDGATSGPGEKDAVMGALVRTIGSYQSLLERYNRDFDAVFERRARSEPEDGDETIQRLRGAQAALVKYPVAGQAAFAALVREGRRFAKTAEGEKYKRRLASSPVLAKARTLFEGLANGLVSESGGALPSVYVEQFLHALDRELEGVLADIAGAGSGR